MTIEEAIERIESLNRNVQDLRAERGLREWPTGHPETPSRRPDFVRDYEARQSARSPNPT